MVNFSVQSEFTDQRFKAKTMPTPNFGIQRCYWLETFTTKTPDKKCSLITFNFQFLLMSAEIVSVLQNCKTCMSHVTKIIATSINIFCQVASWWKFQLHMDVKIKSKGCLPSPTSSILLLYLRKVQFSWQKDISL